jgi:hypothetical protein
MAFEIDTATDHVDLFDRLITFLQLVSGGPGWTLLDYNSTDSRALFVAPGLTALEEIYFGVSLHASVSTDTYALGFWMFRAYNPSLADLEQPGTSVVLYLPVWNTSIPYWFVANAQRLIIATKVSTTYQCGYVGKFLPYGTPGEYPQPYYLAMPVSSSTARWSTTSEDNRNFWDPGLSGRISTPNGVWHSVKNWEEAGAGESDVSGSNYVWPFNGNISTTAPRTRYRELRENVDGTYPLWPLILHGTLPDDDIYGEIDGAFAVSGFNNASENVVEIGADDYLVLQNMHRTGRYYYAAVKLE